MSMNKPCCLRKVPAEVCLKTKIQFINTTPLTPTFSNVTNLVPKSSKNGSKNKQTCFKDAERFSGWGLSRIETWLDGSVLITLCSDHLNLYVPHTTMIYMTVTYSWVRLVMHTLISRVQHSYGEARTIFKLVVCGHLNKEISTLWYRELL